MIDGLWHIGLLCLQYAMGAMIKPFMCEEEKLVKDMMRGSNLDSARSIKMKENSILFRIQEAEERRLRLYEDYKAEILDEDEYSQLKEHYIAEKQRLEHELQKQRQRALELEKRIKICDAQMERMWTMATPVPPQAARRFSG